MFIDFFFLLLVCVMVRKLLGINNSSNFAQNVLASLLKFKEKSILLLKYMKYLI